MALVIQFVSYLKSTTKKWKRAFYTLQKLANFFTSIMRQKKKPADKSNFYLKILIKNYQLASLPVEKSREKERFEPLTTK